MAVGTIVVIGIVVLVFLAFLMVVTTARRRDQDKAIGTLSKETRDRDRSEETPLGEEQLSTGREVEREAALERVEGGSLATTTTAAPPMLPPMDPETLGVTRRQFLNRGIVTGFALGLGGFGLASLAFLWPSLSGGFGSKIRAGNFEDIMAEIRDKREPFYSAEGRFYLLPYPKEDVPKAKAIPSYAPVLPGYEDGVVALYQRCVHLGCRVPWCITSQWFECPCHGSQYNRVGEKKGGPAPRGLDRFIATVEAGQVIVDTKTVIEGPPIGTNTTGQEAEGPHCVGGGGGH
jgi:cytochrome b6-f complex iron-sulfur subunit